MTPLTKTETRTILISQKTYKKDMTLSLNSREIFFFFESDTLKQFSRPLDRFPKGLIPFHELENGLFFGSGWLYIDKVFFFIPTVNRLSKLLSSTSGFPDPLLSLYTVLS